MVHLNTWIKHQLVKRHTVILKMWSTKLTRKNWIELHQWSNGNNRYIRNFDTIAKKACFLHCSWKFSKVNHIIPQTSCNEIKKTQIISDSILSRYLNKSRILVNSLIFRNLATFAWTANESKKKNWRLSRNKPKT